MTINLHEDYEEEIKDIIEKNLISLNEKYNFPQDFGLKLERLINKGNDTLPNYDLIFAFGYKNIKPQSYIKITEDLGIPRLMSSNNKSVQDDYKKISKNIEEIVISHAISTGRDIELKEWGGDVKNRPLWSYSSHAMIRSAIKDAEIKNAKKINNDYDLISWIKENNAALKGARVSINNRYAYQNTFEENGSAQSVINVEIGRLPETYDLARHTKNTMLDKLVKLSDPRDMKIKDIAECDELGMIQISFTDPIVRLKDAPSGIKNKNPEKIWLEKMLNHKGSMPYEKQNKGSK